MVTLANVASKSCSFLDELFCDVAGGWTQTQTHGAQ